MLLNLLLDFSEKIPSVNDIYTRQKHSKRVILTDSARKFKSLMTDRLTSALKDVDLSNISKYNHFRLEFEFVLRQGFNSRDYDNMIKLIQDELCKFIKINDNRIVEGEQTKYNRNNGSKEFIIIRLKESNINVDKYNGL